MQPDRAKLSPLLADPRLCVVYAEASLPGDDPDDRDPTRPRDLLQWVAARLDGDEVFEALVRPATAMPGEHHLSAVAGEVRMVTLFQAEAARPRWLLATACVPLGLALLWRNLSRARDRRVR